MILWCWKPNQMRVINGVKISSPQATLGYYCFFYLFCFSFYLKIYHCTSNWILILHRVWSDLKDTIFLEFGNACPWIHIYCYMNTYYNKHLIIYIKIYLFLEIWTLPWNDWCRLTFYKSVNVSHFLLLCLLSIFSLINRSFLALSKLLC